MRDIFFTLLVGFGVLAISLLIACTLTVQPANTQLRNPYWPFSVETAIHDR